ncbi:hypothetical protein LN650_23720 [Klebsiella pneumoniae subsp. pneumoniae]|nr:hypothetical protein [Klebsiella pneumoniae subsp. pneumoniae]
MLLLPTLAMKAIAETLRLSGLNVRCLFRPKRDNLDKMGLSTRRDSFCGKISPFAATCASTVSRYADHPARLRYLSGEMFEQDLRRFTQICRVVNSMRGVRVGAIGARPAGLPLTPYATAKLLERLGIAVETLVCQRCLPS